MTTDSMQCNFMSKENFFEDDGGEKHEAGLRYVDATRRTYSLSEAAGRSID